MDESLKARLIGAAVLVALAVILIPELLSGRKESAPQSPQSPGERTTRTFTIELGGGTAETTNSVAVPSTRDVKPVAPEVSKVVPAPAVDGELAKPTPPAGETGKERAAPEPTPASRPAVAEPKPAVAETAPPPPSGAAVARGGWAVQVGAFGSVATANKLVKDLRAAGYPAFVSPVARGGKTLHRVRVGPQEDRAAAEQLLPALKARGLPATLVAND